MGLPCALQDGLLGSAWLALIVSFPCWGFGRIVLSPGL